MKDIDYLRNMSSVLLSAESAARQGLLDEDLFRHYKKKLVAIKNEAATDADLDLLDVNNIYLSMCSRISDLTKLYRGGNLS